MGAASDADYYLKLSPWSSLLLITLVIVFATGFLLPLYVEHEASLTSPLAYVNIEKKGEGEVYVNGSTARIVIGEVPFRIMLEAKPAKYWKLSYWLIGDNREEGNPIMLTVWTNTTLTAVFEKAVCGFVLQANASGAKALVNGTEVTLPYVGEFPCGSEILVKPIPLEGYKITNEIVIIPLEGNVTVNLFYEKLCRVEVSSGELGTVYVNGEPVSGNVVFYAERGWNVSIVAPCEDVNETHKKCSVAWDVAGLFEFLGLRYEGTHRLNVQNATLTVLGDVSLHPVVGLVRKSLLSAMRG